MIETPYYHITGCNRNGQIFLPRIPRYAKNAGLSEEGSIKRVCCSPDIEGCLKSSAASKSHKPIFYVHKICVDNNAKIITNNEILRNKYVYDAEITKETWICSPVVLKFVGLIKIINVTNCSEYSTKLINGDTYRWYCSDYEYEWIDCNTRKQRYSKFYSENLPEKLE